MNFIRKLMLVGAIVLPMQGLAVPVDVNSADAATISESLQGVGMSKAEAIVEYREKHGPFKNADELSLVKGIGERTVELNRADIRVQPAKK